MAVHTVLSQQQIQNLVDSYEVGRVCQVTAVAEGIENTNYFVTTEGQQEFLLTIFEQLQAAQLDFYLQWLNRLAARRLPVALALIDRRGKSIQTVYNKPAVLFPRLPGRHPEPIEPAHCAAIGAALAELHLFALTATGSHATTASLPWLLDLASSLQSQLDVKDAQLLRHALELCRPLPGAELPHGLIHGDLFPDNTLFEGHRLTGLVDFFSGGDGLLVFDLAVTVNAWCSMPEGDLCSERVDAMLHAYNAGRPLTDIESEYWQQALVLAALRFWLSRLADTLRPEINQHPDALVQRKDPLEYRRILCRRMAPN